MPNKELISKLLALKIGYSTAIARAKLKSEKLHRREIHHLTYQRIIRKYIYGLHQIVVEYCE